MSARPSVDQGVPLFGAEAAVGPPLPALRDKTWGALTVKWGRVRQPARGGAILCRDCITRVQEMGVDKAPVPRRAVETRTGPNGALPLCAADAQNHRDADARAQREYEERQAHKDHVTKGDRHVQQ